MPATPSPFASLFAWLTVSVLLLAGAPAQQTTTTPAAGTRQTTLANQLAGACALLDRAQADDSSPRPQLKGKLQAYAPGLVRVAANHPRFVYCRTQLHATTVAAQRLNLVGTIELRI